MIKNSDLVVLIIYIFFVICFLVPSTAYAYLDGGTGNALVYVALSLLGAVFYFIKGLFYKVIKKKKDVNDDTILSISSSRKGIVIFSEGKAYWNTYKSIIENLLEKGQNFTYYTMDIEDPCLQIANRLMENRYIGDGNVAYAKMGNLKADIVLTTTPNIGCNGYPIPRSKLIRNLAYVDHGLFGDFAFLRHGALDYYDTVLLIGEYQIPLIRKLEKLRNLKEKTLIQAGIPYIDELLSKAGLAFEESSSKEKLKSKVPLFPENITVLLAPSHGEKGFLSKYGTDFIEKLADKKFNLIFRPHPQSFKTEKKLMQSVKNKLKNYRNIIWDLNPDATQSFQNADILISDTSGVKLDFSFIYLKPFITMPIPFEILDGFEMVDLGGSWSETEIPKAGIGYNLKETEIHDLDAIILRVLDDNYKDAIMKFRNQHVYNWGNAGKAVAEYLIKETEKMKEER